MHIAPHQRKATNNLLYKLLAARKQLNACSNKKYAVLSNLLVNQYRACRPSYLGYGVFV